MPVLTWKKPKRVGQFSNHNLSTAKEINVLKNKLGFVCLICPFLAPYTNTQTHDVHTHSGYPINKGQAVLWLTDAL